MHDPMSNDANLRMALAAVLLLATGPNLRRLMADLAPATQEPAPTGADAAWRNIGDACEILADSARFLAGRVTPSPRQD